LPIIEDDGAEHETLPANKVKQSNVLKEELRVSCCFRIIRDGQDASARGNRAMKRASSPFEEDVGNTSLRTRVLLRKFNSIEPF